MRNTSFKTQAIEDGVFGRIFVIRGPTTGLFETRLFIETSRRGV
jgi:hypothetical protein